MACIRNRGKFSLIQSCRDYICGIAVDTCYWLVIVSLGAAVNVVIPAAAQIVTEFPLPMANSFPQSITESPDGALWFTEKIGNKIGRITTAGAMIELFISGGQPPRESTRRSGQVPYPDVALIF